MATIAFLPALEKEAGSGLAETVELAEGVETIELVVKVGDRLVLGELETEMDGTEEVGSDDDGIIDKIEEGVEVLGGLETEMDGTEEVGSDDDGIIDKIEEGVEVTGLDTTDGGMVAVEVSKTETDGTGDIGGIAVVRNVDVGSSGIGVGGAREVVTGGAGIGVVIRVGRGVAVVGRGIAGDGGSADGIFDNVSGGGIVFGVGVDSGLVRPPYVYNVLRGIWLYASACAHHGHDGDRRSGILLGTICFDREYNTTAIIPKAV